MALQRCKANPPKTVPLALAANTSPLEWWEWEKALVAHPDRQFADYVVNGIRDGFRVGFEQLHRSFPEHAVSTRPSRSRPRLPGGRMFQGRLLGSFQPEEIPEVHTSRFGVIPKKRLNQWRLILLLLVGNPGLDQCEVDLQRLLGVFSKLNVPVAMEELEGPTTCLSFLGIELDSMQMCLRLPQEKLRALLSQWGGMKFCQVGELRSLTGKLQHTCKVVRPGRTFLRRLLKGTKSRRQPFVRLNVAFHSDFAWWQTFLEAWNGVSMLVKPTHNPPDVDLYTDASGGLGCGAWSGTRWFQYFWPHEFGTHSIAVKELLPVVMACVVWGRSWRRKAVLAHCDNQAVVEVVYAGYSKDPHLMQLFGASSLSRLT